MVHGHARSVGVSVVIGALLLIGGARAAFAQEPPPNTQAAPPDNQAPPPGYPPPGNQAPPPGYPPPGAYAQPPGYPPPYVMMPPPPPRENSINGSPLGILVGNYSLNYERLVNGTHGFLIEGVLSHVTGTATSGTEMFSNKSTTYGGGAGYRWHWSGQQNSGFLGLMAGYTVGTGSSTLTSGGTVSSFDMTVKAPWVVANIGKRWQWDSGINITFRIGGGWARYTVSTTSTDPQAQDAVNSLNDLLKFFPIAIDGELSLGYSF
jgi:hypothetical protein